MTIDGDHPGNLFAAGQPVVVTFQDVRGEPHCRLIDYHGGATTVDVTIDGSGMATARLGGRDPGWWELSCEDAAGVTVASIGVVRDRGNVPLPREGRIGADAASAWLLKAEEQRRPFARMIRLAGIPWVRERLSWGEVERARGRIDWGRYQTVADTLSTEGIHVVQVWHDTPSWARSGRDGSLYPDDLRDIHRFAKAAASRFAHRIDAWEVWNEPDIFFWPDLSDRFAAVQKAVALGLKAGNPDAAVLLGSLCVGVSPFARHIQEAAIGGYYDIFNWHVYEPPERYPPILSAHLDLLRDYGLDRRPVWLTEVGIRITGTEGEGKRLLSREDQKKQCRFVPRSVVMSLAAGTDRHFFFVLPDYLENGVQFGALKPDLTPYPSFVALSAAANLLGSADYRGEMDAGDGVEAHLFRAERGNTLVAWADRETEIAVPTERVSVRAADLFGRESVLAAENRSSAGESVHSASREIRLRVGPDAVYLLDVGNAVLRSLKGPAGRTGRLSRRRPLKTVIVGYADLPIDKSRDQYLIGRSVPEAAGEPTLASFPFTVDVYNFNEETAVSGSVDVETPSGWRIEGESRTLRLDPMERERLHFRIVPAASGLEPVRVVVRGRFGGKSIAPSQSVFAFDPSALRPASALPLEWGDPAQWRPGVSEGGQVTIGAARDGEITVAARFEGEGDRWAYPSLSFDPPSNWSGFDGIAFELETDREDADSFVRLQVVETNGTHYLAGVPFSGGRKKVTLLFRDMTWGSHSPADPNGRLDLDRIAGVKLGLNTKRGTARFTAGRFEAVSFGGEERE